MVNRPIVSQCREQPQIYALGQGDQARLAEGCVHNRRDCTGVMCTPVESLRVLRGIHVGMGEEQVYRGDFAAL